MTEEKDRDLWPATTAALEWLRENYGDDDRVDWRVKQNGDVDTIDFYACDGHVDYLNVREFADPNDVPNTRIRERIEDAYCGNCEHCLAEADREAHDDAAKEKALSLDRILETAKRFAHLPEDTEEQCHEKLNTMLTQESLAADTDVAAVARYDLERACVRHGCQLWTEQWSLRHDTYEPQKTDTHACVTKGGRLLGVWFKSIEEMVRNGESIDDMVKAWAEGRADD